VAYKNALSVYRETRIKTASQGQLIIMLYDAAVRNLDRALELLKLNAGGSRNPAHIEHIGRAVIKAQEIITELSVSLDFEQGKDIARNLFALYTWFNRELLEANIEGDRERIAGVRAMLWNLRSGWAEITAQTAASRYDEDSAGLNIAG